MITLHKMVRNSSALKPDSSRLDNIKWESTTARTHNIYSHYLRSCILLYCVYSSYMTVTVLAVGICVYVHVLLQVLGFRGYRSALPFGSDVGLWFAVHQWEHRHYGIPIHHLQRLPGHVYLHLPLCSAEKGQILSLWQMFTKFINQLELHNNG